MSAAGRRRGDLSRLCWRMQVRVESAPSPGDHEPRHRATTSLVTGRPQGSPLLCYGFASRCVHGGNAPFLFLHPEISLYVSFASSNSCASGTPESMEIAAFAAFRA